MIRDMDQRETIRAVLTPTLVRVGKYDSGTPVSAAEYIHHGITSSALAIIPDAAHFVQMEQSSMFNHALLEFINVNAGG